MNRYVGYGSLLLLLGWLGLSYGGWLPASMQWTIPLELYGEWFQQATLAIVFCFIVIQLWLLWSTVRMVPRQSPTEPQRQPTHLALNLWRELVWTALPLLMTIGIAWVGYALWTSL